MSEKLALRFMPGNFIKPEDDEEWVAYLAGKEIFQKLLKIGNVKYEYYKDPMDFRTHICIKFDWPSQTTVPESEIKKVKETKTNYELPKSFKDLKENNK